MAYATGILSRYDVYSPLAHITRANSALLPPSLLPPCTHLPPAVRYHTPLLAAARFTAYSLYAAPHSCCITHAVSFAACCSAPRANAPAMTCCCCSLPFPPHVLSHWR